MYQSKVESLKIEKFFSFGSSAERTFNMLINMFQFLIILFDNPQNVYCLSPKWPCSISHTWVHDIS